MIMIKELEEARNRIPTESVWDYVDGGSYKVIEVQLNATGYEETHEVGIVVIYEQLVAGSFPAGQIWVRNVTDFEASLIRDGKEHKKFIRRH